MCIDRIFDDLHCNLAQIEINDSTVFYAQSSMTFPNCDSKNIDITPMYEEFEDIHISKKNRQHNRQKKKY